jgi:hypothetical protein
LFTTACSRGGAPNSKTMPESSSSAQPSPGSQPELKEGAQPSVDWAAERAQLVEEGDAEGARLLEKVLAGSRRREQPMHGVFKGHDGQPDRKVVLQPLTDEAILEALRNRRWLRKQRAELRQSLDVDATTPVGICTRWRSLAAWAPRFARHYGEREVIHFGLVDGNFGPVNAASMYPGAPGEEKAPELAWAEAFRESTSTLVALVLDAKVEDVPLQRLLQDLDEVLDGKAVELGPHIREVDVLVRVIAARIQGGLAETAGAGDTSTTSHSIDAPAERSWDPRSSFHRAVLRVYSDLGDLIVSLRFEPNRDFALILLDEAIRRSLVDDGDPQPLPNIKRCVRRLLSALGTLGAIRKAHRGIGREFDHGAGAGWAGICSTCHHAVVIGAANAMLKPQSAGMQEPLPHDDQVDGRNAIREQVLRAASDSASWGRLGEDLKMEYELASLRPPRAPVPDYDEGLALMEAVRLEQKRADVAKATASKDIDQMFSLWQSTIDLLFRSNPGAALSRAEELFHLGKIVFALAEIAHATQHPHAAMNRLSQLLRVVVPLDWFDDQKAHQEMKDAICLAGDEIHDLYFRHRRDTDSLPCIAAKAPGEHSGLSDAFDFSGTSESAVTAVIGTLDMMRRQNPDLTPTQERIKDKAGKAGGAGDRAIQWAKKNRLITPDYLITKLGQQFLEDRR